MGTAEQQGELWGKAPRGWAEIQEPLHGPLWEAMLDAAEVGPRIRFLDAGCGAGGASVLAVERGADVVGIDAAEGLIAFARERVPMGDFHVGDMARLPLEDEAFDVVFAANSVQYTDDVIATLKELGRVCSPGGRVIASLFGPPQKVEFRAIFKAVRDALPEPPSGGGPFALSAPGKLESLFEQAGLAVSGRGEADCAFSYPDFETFWEGNVAAGPFQGLLERVSEARLRSSVREAAETFRRGDGQILIEPNQFRYVVATPGPSANA